MPATDHSTPVNELDAAARAAFAQLARRMGSYRMIAETYQLAPASARAMFRGERDVPPGLAADLAGDAQATGPIASAFRAWAESRENPHG